MALPRLGHRWSALAQKALSELGALHLGPPPVLDALAELFDHVTLWMDQADLCDARSPEELVDHYLGDAAVVVTHTPRPSGPWVNPEARGGAPGLGLALLQANCRVTLVDSDSRCVAFLRTLGSALAPGRTEAVRAPVSALDSRAWQTAIARSTLPAQEWLNDGTRLARSHVWVFPESNEVPTRARWRVAEDLTYRLPLTQTPRRAIRFDPDLG